MFIAANCFVVVAFFCSRTSRYAHRQDTPSALLFIRYESLLPNPNDGFGLKKRPLEKSPLKTFTPAMPHTSRYVNEYEPQRRESPFLAIYPSFRCHSFTINDDYGASILHLSVRHSGPRPGIKGDRMSGRGFSGWGGCGDPAAHFLIQDSCCFTRGGSV